MTIAFEYILKGDECLLMLVDSFMALVETKNYYWAPCTETNGSGCQTTLWKNQFGIKHIRDGATYQSWKMFLH